MFRNQDGTSDDKVDTTGQTWDGYFGGFVPEHKFFYLQGMAMQVLTAFVLNGFAPYPFVQSVLMIFVTGAEFYSVIASAPYSSLSSTREELIGKLGKVLVYFLVFLSFHRTCDLDTAW